MSGHRRGLLACSGPLLRPPFRREARTAAPSDCRDRWLSLYALVQRMGGSSPMRKKAQRVRTVWAFAVHLVAVGAEPAPAASISRLTATFTASRNRSGTQTSSRRSPAAERRARIRARRLGPRTSLDGVVMAVLPWPPCGPRPRIRKLKGQRDHLNFLKVAARFGTGMATCGIGYNMSRLWAPAAATSTARLADS